jgi:predicted branched-subunit amino acid permease
VNNPLSPVLSHPQFREGFRGMASVSPGIAAWGMVTGVAMVKSGLSVPLALCMTFTVYAGSAQLTALPLIAAAAPLWVIWATALCVNLRFVIFSAQMRPFVQRCNRVQRVLLGYFTADLTFVLFTQRFKVPRDDEGQIEYFLGGSAVNWLAWQAASVLGILLADSVPLQWGLGFAGVLALLGLMCSMLTDRATWVSAAVAGGAAVAAYALPLKLNIVVAIVAAVCAGLIMEAAMPALPRKDDGGPGE